MNNFYDNEKKNYHNKNIIKIYIEVKKNYIKGNSKNIFIIFYNIIII